MTSPVLGAGPDAAVGRQTAIGAGPLLARFNVAGVLAAADVHVAQRLGRLCGEHDERVLLAVALTVRAVPAGCMPVVTFHAGSVFTVTVAGKSNGRPSG